MTQILKTVILAGILSFSSPAFAHHETVGGLIIGGTAGAIIGDSIGHSPESRIIGATIGGIIGTLIGGGVPVVVPPVPIVVPSAPIIVPTPHRHYSPSHPGIRHNYHERRPPRVIRPNREHHSRKHFRHDPHF